MKYVNIVAITCMSVLCSAFAQKAEPLRELLDAQFRVQQEVNLLTFTFSQSPSFSHETLAENRIRLRFPRTVSAKNANHHPMIPEDGFVKNIAFGHAGKDTMVVVVTLHERVAFDIYQPQDKREVVIQMRLSDTTKSVVPVIDIMSIARQQMQDSKTEVLTAKSDEPTMFPSFQTIPLVISLAVSLLGTVVMVFWIVKPTTVKTATRTHTTTFDREQNNTSVDVLLAQAQLVLKEKANVATQKLAFDGVPSEQEDFEAMLAKKFQRGQGELRLAKKFASGNRRSVWEKRMQLLGSQLPGQDSVATAKKLGMGKGEFNLATSLRRLQETSLRKETVS